MLLLLFPLIFSTIYVFVRSLGYAGIGMKIWIERRYQDNEKDVPT